MISEDVMSAKNHLAMVVLTAIATAALGAEEGRPRIMHAEMVTAGDARQARGMKVADTQAPAAEAAASKPRMFDMPLIDKSKAEDPYKGAPSPVPAAKSAPVAKAAPAPAPGPWARCARRTAG